VILQKAKQRVKGNGPRNQFQAAKLGPNEEKLSACVSQLSVTVTNT
jgi:hypothetical protein